MCGSKNSLPSPATPRHRPPSRPSPTEPSSAPFAFSAVNSGIALSPLRFPWAGTALRAVRPGSSARSFSRPARRAAPTETQTRKPRGVRIFATFLGLFAVLLGSCSKQPSVSAAPQILRLSQRNEPADLDPATATLPDEFFIIRALSEGLVVPAPSALSPLASRLSPAAVSPAAALSWTTSPDGLVYTFHLRPDARWSNDEPVTAQDFVDSYRRLLTPATAAPKAHLFFAVQNARAFATGALADFSAVGFRAADALTLIVTLEQPTPSFLAYAASGPWIPVNPRVAAQFGRDWTRPKNFVGNGPFTLAEWRPHQRIVVKKNPRFHTPAAVSLPEIHFLTFDSGDTEERAYRAGQIDLTLSVPLTKLDAYTRERPAELHRTPLAETRYLAFNTAHPPLNDVRVRRALALALDRTTLATRVLQGGQQPAALFVPPALRASAEGRSLLAGDNASASRDTPPEIFDPVTARHLLAQAGFPRGYKFPRLELSSWPIGPPVAEALQEMWKAELGIEVSLVSREAKVHVAALREGRYDIAFITAIPDVADVADLLENFTTGAPGNYPHWSDPHYDELLAAARAVAREERALLLDSAETALLEACPLTPLYFNSKNWLMSPRVRDWHEDALWTRNYLGTSLDR